MLPRWAGDKLQEFVAHGAAAWGRRPGRLAVLTGRRARGPVGPLTGTDAIVRGPPSLPQGPFHVLVPPWASGSRHKSLGDTSTQPLAAALSAPCVWGPSRPQTRTVGVGPLSSSTTGVGKAFPCWQDARFTVAEAAMWAAVRGPGGGIAPALPCARDRRPAAWERHPEPTRLLQAPQVCRLSDGQASERRGLTAATCGAGSRRGEQLGLCAPAAGAASCSSAKSRPRAPRPLPRDLGVHRPCCVDRAWAGLEDSVPEAR